MLRANLRDAALAAAKAWSHPLADSRHLAYAIARRFHERPDVAALLPRARRGLEPRGSHYDPPVLDAEVIVLLDSVDSEETAIAVLKRLLDVEPSETQAVTEHGEPARQAETVPEATPPAGTVETETVEEVLELLDRLVGLETVKDEVHSVIAVVQANQARAEAGLPTVNPGLHLVFTGTPGTGKTTVARIIARLYAACGALPGANFMEVARSDLVAGYVGQTAIKTAEVIRKTIPGVLFIDEAYALTPSHPSDFGAEAIATLVKAMEDHRHELAVIVAGYSEEMKQFLESNPGLRSRLKTFIHFPDYGAKELVQIFAGFAQATGLHLPSRSLEKAEGLFERAVDRTDFGNARFARSLFEQAYARMARRAASDGEVLASELMELAPDDLQWNEPGAGARERRIGFRELAGNAEDNEAP
jgi:SpoVK/Ycf46/Vps4 family AAA+-type ATPase